MDDNLSDFFEEHDFVNANNLSGDDLFSILESLEGSVAVDFPPPTPLDGNTVRFGSKENEETSGRLASQKSTSSSTLQDYSETDLLAETSPKSKRLKLSETTTTATMMTSEDAKSDGQHRMSHITVERNRRKQMNEHLSVLRSLMPCFYVKRGDQASIIGGVVDYINELQQVLQSLEAKKQRKAYSEVLSPRVVSSPRVLSPRKPPLSPRLSLPISPRTPQPSSPYKPRMQQSAAYLPPTMPTTPSSSSTSSAASASSININNDINANELFANSESAIADVEVKFSGSNVLLKTVSPPIPGQAVKIIAALEHLSLEILKVDISTVDETMLNSFTIKIGIECQLSAEELAHQIQQTFCLVH